MSNTLDTNIAIYSSDDYSDFDEAKYLQSKKVRFAKKFNSAKLAELQLDMDSILAEIQDETNMENCSGSENDTQLGSATPLRSSDPIPEKPATIDSAVRAFSISQQLFAKKAEKLKVKKEKFLNLKKSIFREYYKIYQCKKRIVKAAKKLKTFSSLEQECENLINEANSLHRNQQQTNVTLPDVLKIIYNNEYSCPICYETLKGSQMIFSNKCIHSVCEACTKKVKYCPMCRTLRDSLYVVKPTGSHYNIAVYTQLLPQSPQASPIPWDIGDYFSNDETRPRQDYDDFNSDVTDGADDTDDDYIATISNRVLGPNRFVPAQQTRRQQRVRPRRASRIN